MKKFIVILLTQILISIIKGATPDGCVKVNGGDANLCDVCDPNYYHGPNTAKDRCVPLIPYCIAYDLATAPYGCTACASGVAVDFNGQTCQVKPSPNCKK